MQALHRPPRNRHRPRRSQMPAEADRYLTEEGIEKPSKLAKGIAALGVHADLMVSSPYVRAMQTATIFGQCAGISEAENTRLRRACFPAPIPPQFYANSPERKMHRRYFASVHAPHVDGLLAAAVAAPHHITSLKKAGALFVELKRLSPPNGQLVWLVTPKIFRKTK